jgi:cell division cycle protein 37
VVSSGTTVSLKAEDFEPTGATAAALENNETLAASASSSASTSSLPKPPQSSNSSTQTKVKAAVGPEAPQTRERFAVISYNDYVLKHERLLEDYSEIRDMEQTQNFLFKNCDILLHEHAQSYMLLSCLEDEMNGKHERMKLVCRQSQILSHITELGQSMKRDPRDVIIPFFRRISEKEYLNNFLKAVDEFKERIQKRAVEKRKEMDRDRQREAAGEAPVGPGGLDPYEVSERNLVVHDVDIRCDRSLIPCQKNCGRPLNLKIFKPYKTLLLL